MGEKDEYEEITNDFEFWNPLKRGESIAGKVKDTFQSDYGEQLIISTSEGVNMVVPNHTVLARLLKDVKIGDEIKVQFTGEKPSKTKGHGPLKLYRVFLKK